MLSKLEACVHYVQNLSLGFVTVQHPLCVLGHVTHMAQYVGPVQVVGITRLSSNNTPVSWHMFSP